MSWNNKDQEIINELKSNNIDICSISETKKKGKGKYEIDDYTLIYSGVSRDKRGHSGVGLLIDRKYKDHIEKEEYISDRILLVTLNVNKENIHLISVYAPDISKDRAERESFYEELQEAVDRIQAKDKIVIMGDLNARVGNEPLGGVTQRFNEEVMNDNGDLLKAFCAVNALRINNTFFEHDMKYKYTWQNTRGQQSVIDYIITNRSITPQTILDVRTLNAANIGSDHKLLLCKLRLSIPASTKPKPHRMNKFNIESLEDNNTKLLFENRLTNKINENPTNREHDIDEQWKTIKDNILGAAEEAIGKREININKVNNTPWFTPEIKELSSQKKEFYIRYLRNKTPENWNSYKNERNRVNATIRAIKEDYWERFTKGMERDMYGSQRRIWGMLRRNKQEIKDTVQTNKITIDQWETYFKNLYRETEQIEQPIIDTEDDNNIELTIEMIEDNFKSLKNRKSPGPNEITNEMLKYGGPNLQKEILAFFQNIISKQKIPAEWKNSTTIPIFKKGQKTVPENYRGITLLDSTLKAFTKTILQEISKTIQIRDEQQGFRKNRSTIDAIFIVRQIVEKSLELNKPAYMCFVDMTKAFDRVRLTDILQILETKGLNPRLINLIYDINTNCKTAIKVQHLFTNEILIQTGIRQGDSLSPFIFNLIMDQIIENLPKTAGYKMGNTFFHVVCYADDAVLIADTEDNLQRLLHAFNLKAKQLNMIINTEKTKCLVTSKEAVRCKLEVDSKLIEQVNHFQYLGVGISSYGNLQKEVREHTMKASRISGCLNDIVWRNKYLNTESKIRIYKAAIRPVITYAAETRPDTAKTMQMMRTTEMKVLRSIHGKTLHDRARNEDIREWSKIQDIGRWVRQRRRHWNKHVRRMDDNRLAKKAQQNNPIGKRSQGRPPKRWRECWTSSSGEDLLGLNRR